MSTSIWDTCTSQCWDIARCISQFSNDKHRYIGSSKWECFDNGEWKLDKHQHQFINFIRTEIAGQVLNRAIFFQKQTEMDRFDRDTTVLRLLTISNMVQNTKDIKAIITHAREFAAAD